MPLFNDSGRKGLTPRVLAIFFEILVCLTFLASNIYAGVNGNSSMSNRLMRITNPAGSISHLSIKLPSKVIANNRFIAGVTFGGFNFKRAYPYFSVDLKNAHNPSFHPLENHHLYSGIALLALGRVTNQRYLKTMGTVLIIDDLIEHGFNVESALHFTANKIDRPLYAKITKQADLFFGRGKR